MDELLDTRSGYHERGHSTALRAFPPSLLEATRLEASLLELRLAERQRAGGRTSAVDWSFDRYCSTRISFHPHGSRAHAVPAPGRATLEIDPAHVALLAPLVKALDEAMQSHAPDSADHGPDGAPPRPARPLPPRPARPPHSSPTRPPRPRPTGPRRWTRRCRVTCPGR